MFLFHGVKFRSEISCLLQVIKIFFTKHQKMAAQYVAVEDKNRLDRLTMAGNWETFSADIKTPK